MWPALFVMKFARADFGFFFQSEGRPLPDSFKPGYLPLWYASSCSGSESTGSVGPLALLPPPPREECVNRPRAPLPARELLFERAEERLDCIAESDPAGIIDAEEVGCPFALAGVEESNRACFDPRASSSLVAAAWDADRFAGGPIRDARDFDVAEGPSCIRRGRLCLNKSEARRIRTYDENTLPN